MPKLRRRSKFKSRIIEERWTIRDLAAYLGVTYSYVSKVIRGVEDPSPTFREVVSELLNYPEEELFGADPYE